MTAAQRLGEALGGGMRVFARDDVEVDGLAAEQEVAWRAADGAGVGHGGVQCREQVAQLRA